MARTATPHAASVVAIGQNTFYYLLKDDPELSPRALEIIAANDCFVTRLARKLRTAPPVQFAVK